ncbi:hypothetical protein GALMADRAFT_230549 [Galerina marginata CBS 339.88]|uniref:Uncharacterized protein n=1 Tax=Galerina marginata (strain CBS 339.88) TaxID=685588 RepID=A0A067SS08_GALM3|nr:hypothetical protein GALMADRAFT_230549 [Galerina marginata CBS 339.88]
MDSPFVGIVVLPTSVYTFVCCLSSQITVTPTIKNASFLRIYDRNIKGDISLGLFLFYRYFAALLSRSSMPVFDLHSLGPLKYHDHKGHATLINVVFVVSEPV